jgi:hypothetical protein
MSGQDAPDGGGQSLDRRVVEVAVRLQGRVPGRHQQAVAVT